MKPQSKLIMTTTIALVASALALTSATFAWIKYSRSVTNMVALSTGNSEVTIEAHIYEKRYGETPNTSEVAYYVDQTHRLNVTQSSLTNSQVNVDFSNALATDYLLTRAYYNENAYYVPGLPTYYLELRFIQPDRYGYVTANLQYVSIPTATSSELNFSTAYPFNYRYVAVDNSASSPMVSAFPSQLPALEAKTLASFFRTSGQRTSGITLFDASDLSGSPVTNTTGLANQSFIPKFATKVSGNFVFATSLMIELSMDGALFQSFVRANPTLLSYPLRFGIDFNLNISYSNSPIYA